MKKIKLVTTFCFQPEQLREIQSLGVETVQYKDERDLIDGTEYEDADIIIANHRTLQKPLLDKCRNLKWVQVPHIGIERLPMDELERRGIIVINARGSLGVPIAEHIICCMLMLCRKSAETLKNQFSRSWTRLGGFINLYGKTAGIIGTGDVGTETAKRARAFGMKVVGLNTDGRSLPEFDRTYGPDHLNEVIAESDFIILTLPLTEQTEGMLDREQFERMKAGAYLINISRGALINEEVMLEYLRKKKIAGAALDVFVDEFRYGYLPEESPFWNLDNVIITPHCAGGGDGFAERFSSVFLQNLRLFVAGHTDRMLNVREFGKGY